MTRDDRNWVGRHVQTDLTYILRNLVNELRLDINEFDSQVQDSNRNYGIVALEERNYSFKIAKLDEKNIEIDNIYIEIRKQENRISVTSKGILNYPEFIIEAQKDEHENVVYNINPGNRSLSEIWELSQLILIPLLFGESVSEEYP